MKTITICAKIILLLLIMIALGSQVNAQLSGIEQLGKEIFFDKIASPDNMSCADCHGPAVGFTGPIPGFNKKGAVYHGAIRQRFGNRKPPSAAYATLSPIFHFDEDEELFVGGNFWDGRATGEHLGNPAADQALGPFLNPVEQNNASKQDVLIQIASSGYAWLWEAVWGEPLDPYDEAEIDDNYDNVGLAIAAYEGSSEVNAFTSKFDYYLDGLVELTEEEEWGMAIFIAEEPGEQGGAGKCALCHIIDLGPEGEHPLFTDFTFDNLGTPRNPDNPFYDMDEVYLPNGDPINPEGEDWIDPGLGGFLAGHSNPDWQEMADENMGKHKVPTLRNVDKRPGNGFPKAYMHNGVFKSLKEVVHFYNTRDVEDWPEPEVNENVNEDELGNLGLTNAEEDAIVAFMKTLSDGYVLPKAAPLPEPEPVISLLMTCRNPVTSGIRILFDLPEASRVIIDVYNLAGQNIGTLYNGFQPEGSNTLDLPIGSLKSGMFILRMTACNRIVTKKITVVN